MKKYIKYILLSLFSAVAIFLNLKLFVKLSDVKINSFDKINELCMGLSLIGLLYFYIKNDGVKITKLKHVLAFLFSIFMILGECYITYKSMTLMWVNYATILLTIVKIIGYYELFKLGFIYLDKLIIKKYKSFKIKNKVINRYLELLDKYPFRTSLISILIVWAFYMIAFYPIVLSPDPSNQIIQYFNVPNKYVEWVIQRDPKVFMTAHHPITQTYLIGWAISLGRMMGSDNLGLFIYTLGQTLIYSSVLAYSIKFMNKFKIKSKFTIIVLLMYMFVPMYAFYTVSAVKDTLYTTFMFIYVLFLYDYIKNYKDKNIEISKLAIFTISSLLLCLFRNNGVYIMILTLPFILLYNKKNIFKVLIAFLLFMIPYYSFNHILVPALGVSPGSPREMLSVPFQQTARVVRDYPDDVKSNERKIIDKILDYETLASRYKGELSDPVKNEYNKNTTKEDLKEYFKVWFDMGLRHPVTYVDATLNNIYGYLAPNKHKWYIYYNYYDLVTEDNLVNYKYNKMGWLRDILAGYGNVFPHIPVVGLLSNIAFNFWWMLILAAYIIEKKKKNLLIVLIPLFLSVAVCFVGPANTYFRYTMPYIFLLPTLSVLLINDIRGEKDVKGKE
jgi:hypothetical protein